MNFDCSEEDAGLAERFDFEANLAHAGCYGSRRSAYWPPAASFRLLALDLAQGAPQLAPRFYELLARLRDLIDIEWSRSKADGRASGSGFERPAEIALVLRLASDELPHPADRMQLRARADCIEHGYSDNLLAQLAQADGDVAIVAAPLSTWFGKETTRRPSAFATRIDHDIVDTLASLPSRMALSSYVDGLRPGLSVNEGPTFVPGQLFFMAGEGNLHPKHIAYFLPEDEGVRRSPFKKTYYFSNTHRRILDGESYPLLDAIVDLGSPRTVLSASLARVLPAAGVYGHELGHFVARRSTSYATLNRLDRWTSVAMQEVSADVFGALFVMECWAESLGATMQDVVSYYLAECLRYAHRGLGFFPDSDGMLLQLNYLQEVGALQLTDSPHGLRLVCSPPSVVAGLRSLARTLADSLLDDQPDLVVQLFKRYGPANRRLLPLLKRPGNFPSATIEYIAEHI